MRTTLAQRLIGQRALFGAQTKATVKREDIHPMEGNEAAAYVAYQCSENAFIYPISPATSMGELMDSWSVHG